MFTSEQRAKLTPEERTEYATFVTELVVTGEIKNVKRLRELQDKAGIIYTPALLNDPDTFTKKWFKKIPDNKIIDKDVLIRFKDDRLKHLPHPEFIGSQPCEHSDAFSFWVPDDLLNIQIAGK